MNRLIEAGLFGDGLVPVDTPEMVSRYNSCLESMGLDTTNKKSFQVDMRGWSPQIAEEMDHTWYLSHGLENPNAIIITPEQARASLYQSAHSFDWVFLKSFYEFARRPITELTAERGICLDIDQGFTRYNSPLDLLLVDRVVAHASTPDGIMEIASEQRLLVERFMSSGDDWMDPELLASLEQSAKEHGDMRSKAFVIPDMPYMNVGSFYTETFDGVYVFRGLSGSESQIIVCKNKKVAKVLRHDAVYSMKDANDVFKRLVKSGLLEVNLDWYKKNVDELRNMLDYVLVDAAFEHDVDFLSASKGRRKKLVSDLSEEKVLPEMYFEIEELIRILEGRGDVGEVSLSDDAELFLSHPPEHLPREIAEVVWMFLVYVCPINVPMLYAHDKREFFERYQSWPTNKQDWAIETIKNWYVHRTNR